MDALFDLPSYVAQMNPALALVIALAYFAGFLWLLSDAYDRWGHEGGVAVGVLYFALAPLFPFVLIAYILLRQYAYRPYRKGQREAGEDDPWEWRSEKPDEGEALRYSTSIADDERDERIDEMLAQGKGREAMDYAQQMFKMAQDFKDANGQTRYRKYIERIRTGIK